MRLRSIAYVGIAAALSACMSSPPPAGPKPEGPDACGASGLQAVLGQNINGVDVSGHDPLRIIPPGAAVTMDFRADRLNIAVDDAGTITRIFCG